MAVSMNWAVLLVGILRTRALTFGFCTKALDFWKLPYAKTLGIMTVEYTYSNDYPVMQDSYHQQ